MNVLVGRRIAILGCGAMGGALGRGLVESGAAIGAQIVFSDPHSAHLLAMQKDLGVGVEDSNLKATEKAEIIVLAVKPFNVVPVILEVGQAISSEQTVISIAAGITIRQLEENLAPHVPVVRSMPNCAAQVLSGACAISPGTSATETTMELARAIFGSVGTVVQVPESALDAVTALSGSGPAYVYLMIESLIDGGVKVGLPRDIAHQLAVQTVLGAAKMARDTGRHPAQLKDIVATPGGTTITALASLEKDGFRASLIDAVEKATIRAKELGQG